LPETSSRSNRNTVGGDTLQNARSLSTRASGALPAINARDGADRDAGDPVGMKVASVNAS